MWESLSRDIDPTLEGETDRQDPRTKTRGPARWRRPVADAGPAGAAGSRTGSRTGIGAAGRARARSRRDVGSLPAPGRPAVRLVTTPELALAELTCGPDAVAVLDLTMPGLDPRRIRRALRTPVIFLVAGPRPRGLARAGARRGSAAPSAPGSWWRWSATCWPASAGTGPGSAAAQGAPPDASAGRLAAGWPEPDRDHGRSAGAADRDRVRVARGHDGPPGPGAFPAAAARRRGPPGRRRPGRRRVYRPAPGQARAGRGDQDRPRRRLRDWTPYRGVSNKGTRAAGLRSVAQQYRF